MYEMPVYLRKFYIRELIEYKQEEKKQIENRGGLKKLVFKKGIPVEESLAKALEEQNFLKAGNDWVLNIN